MNNSPVTLITGTSRGIGRGLAKHYLSRGHRVFGCSRTPVGDASPGYTHHCLDVSNETEVKQLFAELRQSFGRLDALINNAGIAAMNHALLTPARTAEGVLRTNVLGVFLFCREAAKLMQRQRRGRIVNIVSVATPLKLEGEAVYAASKAAVLSLTQILAREFAEFGITVNAVGPTPIETDLIRGVPQEKIERLIQRQAIHRMGEVRDITNVIDFFLSDASDFVTGQVIFLGGV